MGNKDQNSVLTLQILGFNSIYLMPRGKQRPRILRFSPPWEEKNDEVAYVYVSTSGVSQLTLCDGRLRCGPFMAHWKYHTGFGLYVVYIVLTSFLSEDEWLEKFPIRNNEDSDLEEEEEEEMFPAELSSSTEGQEESLTQSHYQKDRNYRQVFQYSPDEVVGSSEPLSPTDYFNGYISENILESLTVETQENYFVKTGNPLQVNKDIMKKFIGINFIMGVLKFPSGSCQKESKLWKLEPLILSIRQRCMELERTPSVAVDEMIFLFTGRTVLKQFCPRKPNPHGLKVFVLASPDGLILDFEFYQGKEQLMSSVAITNLRVGFNILNIGEAGVLRFVNSHGIEPTSQCQRWCKKTKTFLNIQRPKVIEAYNVSMGGVDIADQVLSYYRNKSGTAKYAV
ncbi:piggyBac transposable element-derived protein 3-like [Penaeus vannamei]|uniref:piggyBac transposable element-derived protein 3-like n=1 Tax=Penaeus vannamei TaxID=6689 RepID=UPI00387F4EF8